MYLILLAFFFVVYKCSLACSTTTVIKQDNYRFKTEGWVKNSFWIINDGNERDTAALRDVDEEGGDGLRI